MAFGVLFMQAGLTEDIVQKISDEKDDPVWMREFRMKSLQIYRQMQIPDWGPPIDGLDSMIVSGFADDVSKELPLEYAVEMNNLIQLEMKGSIG